MTTHILHRDLMIATLGVALLAFTPGCKRATSETAPPPPTVGVAEVVERTVPIVREYVGRTEAVPTVELRARVPGVLEQVLPRRGARRHARTDALRDPARGIRGRAPIGARPAREGAGRSHASAGQIRG